MKKIEHKVFSHIEYVREEDHFSGPGISIGRRLVHHRHHKMCSVASIRQSLGYKVSSFRELVSKIAELGYKNSGYNLLYRGQSIDVLDKNQRTKILPGLYRPKEGLSVLHPSVLKQRGDSLQAAVKILKENHKELNLGPDQLYRHWEYYIAILQHYRIRKTPLLDATQSLKVAVSFALPNKAKAGVLYVFGLPHTHGSISHFIDEDITLVKLQNVCPPNALRPHYQEGFLLGRLGQTRSKQAGDNAAYRLVAKYRLENSNSNFWDKDFQPIPNNALLPLVDPFKEKLLEIIGEDNVL